MVIDHRKHKESLKEICLVPEWFKRYWKISCNFPKELSIQRPACAMDHDIFMQKNASCLWRCNTQKYCSWNCSPKLGRNKETLKKIRRLVACVVFSWENKEALKETETGSLELSEARKVRDERKKKKKKKNRCSKISHWLITVCSLRVIKNTHPLKC